jgi:carbon-monoxide dehydrogenase medium subunit
MKPASFEYRRPETVDEAVFLLAEHGSEAKVLAGGQSLVPMLNLRLARPRVLVDVNRLALHSVELGHGLLKMGATVRQHRLIDEIEIASAIPVLSHAARFVAHPAIRNRGTVGGSLAHADPAAELALIAVLNAATMIATSGSGQRRIEAEQFFQGPFTTTLADDELLTDVEFRVLPGVSSFGFAEAAERNGDFALAAAAVEVRWSQHVVSEARVAVAGGVDVPRRLPAVEELMRGSAADATSVLAGEAAELAVEDLEFVGDIHASAEHRRSLVGELVSRTVLQALAGHQR